MFFETQNLLCLICIFLSSLIFNHLFFSAVFHVSACLSVLVCMLCSSLFLLISHLSLSLSLLTSLLVNWLLQHPLPITQLYTVPTLLVVTTRLNVWLYQQRAFHTVAERGSAIELAAAVWDSSSGEV